MLLDPARGDRPTGTCKICHKRVLDICFQVSLIWNSFHMTLILSTKSVLETNTSALVKFNENDKVDKQPETAKRISVTRNLSMLLTIFVR